MKKGAAMKTAKRIEKKVERKIEPVVEQLRDLGDQLGSQLKKAHAAYDKLDSKKQKKILAGVAGALALLAGMHAIKNHSKNKKKVM